MVTNIVDQKFILDLLNLFKMDYQKPPINLKQYNLWKLYQLNRLEGRVLTENLRMAISIEKIKLQREMDKINKEV